MQNLKNNYSSQKLFSVKIRFGVLLSSFIITLMRSFLRILSIGFFFLPSVRSLSEKRCFFLNRTV